MSVRLSTLKREIVALLQGGPLPPAEISRKLFAEWGDGMSWVDFVSRVTAAANELKTEQTLTMNEQGSITIAGMDLI